VSDLTLILQAVSCGDKQPSEELLPLVYEELRRLAAARMAQESAGYGASPGVIRYNLHLSC
jgi:hypothetical protein